MRAYADSSFLVKLVGSEADSGLARAEYWRLGAPRLFFLPLHSLEVENAVRLRAYHLERTVSGKDRRRAEQEISAALARLQHRLGKGLLQEVEADWPGAISLARTLSQKYTLKLGARSLDLFHVAFALQLETEVFLTTDLRQARLAKASGLEVVATRDE